MKAEDWSEKAREMAKRGEIDAEELADRVSDAMETVHLLAGWGILDRVAEMSTGRIGFLSLDDTSERQRFMHRFLRAWTRFVKDAQNLRRVALEAPVEAWSGKAPFQGGARSVMGGIISVAMNLQMAAGELAALSRHVTQHQLKLDQQERARQRGESVEEEGEAERLRKSAETEECIAEIENFLRGVEESLGQRAGESEETDGRE